MQRSRVHPMFYVLIPLIALGIVYRFDYLLQSLLIPIVILLFLFAMYWLSPAGRAAKPRYRGGQPQRYDRFRQSDRGKPKAKRSPSPFRVIEGSRKDKEDDTPRYH